MDGAFEFITKMNLPYYCFHDVDMVDYTNDVADNEKRLQAITEYAKQKQAGKRRKIIVGNCQSFFQQKIYERGCYQS